MTVEEIAVAALARAMEHSDKVPTTRSVLYRRIGQRQQDLFAMAARISPDYYGVCAKASLRDGDGEWVGAADIAAIAGDVPPAEQITRIEILDAGTSTYAVGDEVNIVPQGDPNVAFPPRVTLRNRVIRQVGTDLEGVEKLEVFYSRSPVPVTAADEDREMELPAQFQELLVVDAARDLFRRSTLLPNRPALVALMDAEEKPLLADYLAHVQRFAGPLVSRFDAQTRNALP